MRLMLLLLTTCHVAAMELALIEPGQVRPGIIRELKADNFQGIALVLQETNASREQLELIRAGGMEIYYWIEVARNVRMAEAHPEWMGSIGMHGDWQRRFPEAKVPAKGQVAKAFPWVPVTGKQAFDAHLARIKKLLGAASSNYRGLILNDLQGPPSSCGCGNLQCRWAVDYHVPATTEQSSADDAAGRFLAAVRKVAPGKVIIPVWTTECEDEDLPPKHRHGESSTGLCGEVGCAVGLCPKEFAKQWGQLTREHSGPIALLATHGELQRSGPEWISKSLAYLETHGGTTFPRTNLWLVVRGRNEKEERAARGFAARLGVRATVVARVQIDQSYSPRLLSLNP